jgi:hypothetical protein
MKAKAYVVVDIGCLECGVSSEIVGVFSHHSRAQSIAEACNDKFSWRGGGQNSFEVFELPQLDCINPEFAEVTMSDSP